MGTLGDLYFANGNRYDGTFVDDKMNGKGDLYFANGNRYDGTLWMTR